MRVVLAALVMSCAPCAAQQAVFLTPSEATVRVGTTLELRTNAGGADLEWPADRTDHFFARTAWTQENRGSVAAQEGDASTAAWVADRVGVLMFGLDLQPRTETLEAGTFAAFQSVHVSAERRVALPKEGSVEVRRVESAKALVRVEGDATEPESIAMSKTGQAVEIRPLMDPTRARVGSDVPLKVYSQIGGASRALVLATNTTTGETVRAQSDDWGIADVPIVSAGRWQVEVHAIRSMRGVGSYELHTATLTFDVGDAP